jgi:protein SCO1/2
VTAGRRGLGRITAVAAAMLLAACGRPALPTLGHVPPLSLVDQDGRPLDAHALEGHPTIVNFLFTSCPTICPTLTAKMRTLQQQTAGTPVRLLSVSVDPETDTPTVLRAYGERFGADFARWSFATGPRESLEKAVVDGFKLELSRTKRPGEADIWDIVHGEHFVLVDGRGALRGYYRAEPEPMRRLVDDARRLVE